MIGLLNHGRKDRTPTAKNNKAKATALYLTSSCAKRRSWVSNIAERVTREHHHHKKTGLIQCNQRRRQHRWTHHRALPVRCHHDTQKPLLLDRDP